MSSINSIQKATHEIAWLSGALGFVLGLAIALVAATIAAHVI